MILGENTLQALTTASGKCPAFTLQRGSALPPPVLLAHPQLSHPCTGQKKTCGRLGQSTLFYRGSTKRAGPFSCALWLPVLRGVIATGGVSCSASPTALSPHQLTSGKWDGGPGCPTAFLAAGKQPAPWIQVLVAAAGNLLLKIQ